MASDIIKSVILPELEREVNQGKNFAPLRQIYHSSILGTWFKKNLKEAIFNKVYVGKSKIEGIDLEQKNVKDEKDIVEVGRSISILPDFEEI